MKIWQLLVKIWQLLVSEKSILNGPKSWKSESNMTSTKNNKFEFGFFYDFIMFGLIWTRQQFICKDQQISEDFVLSSIPQKKCQFLL